MQTGEIISTTHQWQRPADTSWYWQFSGLQGPVKDQNKF